MISLPETAIQGAQESRSTAPARPIVTRAPARSAEQDSDGGTLLIVEDEPLLAMQLSHSLRISAGTCWASRGRSRMPNRILHDTSRPDAAILDVDLGGSPVFPLARSLRRSGIPFIFCTGYEDLDYSSEFSSCTAVRKPATVQQIVRALRDVVRTASAQAIAAPAH